MKSGKKCLFLVGLFSFVVSVVPAAATIYTFVDEKGVIHFTNVPTDTRCRPTMGRAPMRTSWPSVAQNYDPIIHSAASCYEMDPRLVKAVIHTESNFDPWAVSGKGAMGLMQLMPDTAKDLQVSNPFDPRENIFAGTRYLKQQLDNFNGNLELALAAYNAGPTLVSRLAKVPAIAETEEYIKKVKQTYQYYLRSVFPRRP